MSYIYTSLETKTLTEEQAKSIAYKYLNALFKEKLNSELFQLFKTYKFDWYIYKNKLYVSYEKEFKDYCGSTFTDYKEYELNEELKTLHTVMNLIQGIE